MSQRPEGELRAALALVDRALAEGNNILTQVSLWSCKNVLRYALGEKKNGFTDFMDEYRRASK